MPNPDLIRSAEAAGLIGVSQRTFNRWVEHDILPIAMTLEGDGTRLFHRHDVEALAASRAERADDDTQIIDLRSAS